MSLAIYEDAIRSLEWLLKNKEGNVKSSASRALQRLDPNLSFVSKSARPLIQTAWRGSAEAQEMT